MPSVYSPKLKLTFVHNPRTAGTTIGAAIYHLDNNSKLWWQHQEIDQEIFKKSFITFSVIRNPWDRVVSGYYFFKQGKLHHNDEYASILRNNLLKENNISGDFPSFEDWVENKIGDSYKVSKDIIDIDILTPQTEIVKYADTLVRFENMKADLQKIEEILKFKFNITDNHNVSIRNKDYRTYYNTKTKNLIGEYYYQDIIKFNYCF